MDAKHTCLFNNGRLAPVHGVHKLGATLLNSKVGHHRVVLFCVLNDAALGPDAVWVTCLCFLDVFRAGAVMADQPVPRIRR